ncbi:hypothetical protein V6N12_014134 [Hibiscus sabdariffa]|uniref:Uncharacterized protein n=1 Tax=Hibiscus sabdariffa TaxID=183260 RepID=A0ABR2DJ88_9ROSI
MEDDSSCSGICKELTSQIKFLSSHGHEIAPMAVSAPCRSQLASEAHLVCPNGCQVTCKGASGISIAEVDAISAACGTARRCL